MSLKSNFELVKEFHDKFNIPTATLDDEDTQALRLNLILEEMHEVEKELCPEPEIEDVDHAKGYPTPIYGPIPSIIKSKLAKELADLLYVVYGTATTFNIDIDIVFAMVHASNMSKLGEDDLPVYRKDGKVIKGPNYQPPNLTWLDK